MRGLTLAEADRIRAERHGAVLLYLTDSCPVGCAHCSVDAMPRGGRPADVALLEHLVDGLCGLDRLRLVGISGGEPFMERRALDMATARLAAAGKLLVLYTSGNWGRDDGTVPGWTGAVLRRASCLVLSTDSYHAARIPQARFLAAARAAARVGTWIAVQVAGTAGELTQAERLLEMAFGPSWPDSAEIRPTELLARGRGRAARLASGRPGTSWPADSLGTCRLARAPVVRYDGRVTACCNKEVVTAGGPKALQAAAAGAAELREVLDGMAREPYLSAIAGAGPAELTRLPRYRDLRKLTFPDVCALCWALLGRGADQDPAVRAIGLISR